MRSVTPTAGSMGRAGEACSPLQECGVGAGHARPEALRNKSYTRCTYLWRVCHNGIMKRESVRTTIDIPASMYRQLKEQAAAQGQPARALILAGIEKVLLRNQRPRPRRVQFPLIRSKGPKANLTNEQIYKLVEFP